MRRLTIEIAAAVFLACCAAPAQSTTLAERLEAAARSGNAEASYHLGMLYNEGIGVQRDNARALELFRSAAEAGDPLGAYKLGCYYAGQFGVIRPNEDLALRHKLVAAEAGYMLAQLDVAIIYYTRENYAEALRWFEAAGRQGDAQSLYNLSVLNREGRGTAPSRPRAHAFFRLAHLASRGSVTPGAQETLDEMFAEMDAQERAEAQRLAANFVTGPSELTQLAFAGMERAEVVARGGN